MNRRDIVLSSTVLLTSKGCYVFENFHLTSQKKKINLAIRHFQEKQINLTIDSLSLGIHAPNPQVLTYRLQILRGARI